MQTQKKHLFLSLLLPIQIGLVQFLSQKSHWIENIYSTGLYPYISKFLRIFLGWIPFSVGDILGFILVFILLKNSYKLIRTKFKNFIPVFLKFTSFLSILYACFYWFWGFNYFREPLAKNLGLQQNEYTTEALVKTTQKIQQKLNAIHLKIVGNDTLLVTVPYEHSKIYELAPLGYKELAKQYPQLQYKSPSLKSSVVSWFHMYSGTSGYFNPITNEAQVNYMIPKTGYPATTCHEMAHQIGWAAENDANFVGFLAASHHPDNYFKYAAYRMAYNYCIREIFKRDKELGKQIQLQLNKGIHKDYRNSYKHWNQFKNPIEPYLKKGYNSYLKANNQAKGIASYSYVVDLLIAYSNQQQL